MLAYKNFLSVVIEAWGARMEKVEEYLENQESNRIGN